MNGKSKITAVVAGTGTYNDLGMIRSCGEAGMNVVYIAPFNKIIPIHRSRYIVRHFFGETEESLLMDAIKETVKEFASPVVIFPTADISAFILDKNWEKLESLGCVFSHACGCLQNHMDKASMTASAAAAGLCVPESRRFDLYSDTDFSKVQYPCIIKPLRSIAGDKSDITVCRTPEQFRTAVSVYKGKCHNEVLVQELIEGFNQKEIAITGVILPSGRIFTYGEIEKYRVRGNGSTVFGVYRPNNSNDLQPALTRYLQSVGYRGIFDMEFLQNDKGTWFIECNFRNGAYGYVTTRAGLNMPLIFATGMLNEESVVLPQKFREKIFMEERSDLLNVFDKTVKWGTWLKDVMRTDVFLFWNKKDMKPLIRIPAFLKKGLPVNR